MDKKKIFWGIASFLIAILTVWAIMSQGKNSSPEMIWEFIKSADKFWLCMSLVSMFGFIWFEGIAIVRIAEGLGYKKTMKQGTLYGAADVYFSAITPSATGGQPASAYFMIRDGMPGYAVTVILVVNLIMYTLALLSLGAISLLAKFHYVWNFSLISRILILIGIIVLSTMGILFYMLLRRADFLRAISDSIVFFFDKLHLVRFNQRRREKLDKMIADYGICSSVLVGKKKMLIEVFFWNVMQRLSQFGVSFTIFMAAGSDLKKALDVLFVQCFVSLGSNSVPIPGSMGVADYIMLDGLKMIVGEEQSVNMELLCRGISFYGCVITGLVIVAVGYLLSRLKREKKC